MKTLPRLLLAALLSTFYTPHSLAVSDAACSWLRVAPSAIANGMGLAHSPLAEDNLGTWLAPGAYPVKEMNGTWELTWAGYPDNVNWLPAYNLDEIYFNNQSIGMRLDLNRLRENRGKASFSEGATQLNIQLIRIFLNEGEQIHTSESGEIVGLTTSKEFATGLRVGLGTEGERWTLGFGLGLDHVVSDHGSGVMVGQHEAEKARATAGSIGLNGQWQPFPAFKVETPQPLWLDMRMGGQLSRMFVGQEISYVDEAQSDPLPRHDRLSLAARLRFKTPRESWGQGLTLLEAHFAFEHAASLIDRKIVVTDERYMLTYNGEQVPAFWDENGNLTNEASDSAGNLNEAAFVPELDTRYEVFNKKLFYADRETQRGWGWELGIAQTLYFRKGQYRDLAGSLRDNTSGTSLSSRGLSLLFAKPVSRFSSTLGWFLRHFEATYSKARLDTDVLYSNPRSGTEYKEVRITYLH